jgi:hypothetical protein
MVGTTESLHGVCDDELLIGIRNYPSAWAFVEDMYVNIFPMVVADEVARRFSVHVVPHTLPWVDVKEFCLQNDM